MTQHRCQVHSMYSEQFVNRLKEKTYSSSTKLKHMRAWKCTTLRRRTLTHSTLFFFLDASSFFFFPCQIFPLGVWKEKKGSRQSSRKFSKTEVRNHQATERRPRRTTGEPAPRARGPGPLPAATWGRAGCSSRSTLARNSLCSPLFLPIASGAKSWISASQLRGGERSAFPI